MKLSRAAQIKLLEQQFEYFRKNGPIVLAAILEMQLWEIPSVVFLGDPASSVFWFH
jgi:hypothetical protein